MLITLRRPLRIRAFNLLPLASLVALTTLCVTEDVQSQKPFNPPPVGVLTQRYNPQRTGANPDEHILNIFSVSSPEFQKLYTIPVMGQVYAQPLLVPQVPFPDGSTKNVLIVATMLDAVQAFQVDDAVRGPAFSPVPLWQATLGTPLPGNFMAMESSSCSLMIFNICINLPGHLPPLPMPLPPIPSTADFIVNNNLGLYNINPFVGIVSTPVIDPARRAVFAVGKVWQGSLATVETHLAKIDLVTGAVLKTVVVGASTSVPGTSRDSQNGMVSFEQTHHMQRAALLLQNGQLYLGLGSHQDTKPWHGWIFRFDPETLQQNAVWCSTPNAEGGSIWQAGNGIAGDATGNIYVMTGNGCSESDCKATNGQDNSFNAAMSDFAGMFVQLNPQLSPIGSFAPGDEQHREDEDLDVGSSGPIFLPGTSILIGAEKESLLFVLDASTHLGARQVFHAGQKFDTPSIGGSGYHHNHGDPVAWRSSDHGIIVYLWPERDNLRAFFWDDGKGVFDCSADPKGCETGNTTTPDQLSTFQSPTCPGCMPGGILSVSAEGTDPATGILWASVPFNTQGSFSNASVGGGLNNIVPGVLRAFDADEINLELWNSEANSSRDGSFMFAKFNPPMVANGRVYLATFGSTDNPQSMTGSVNVYGLRQWAKFLGFAVAPPASITAGAAFSAQATYFNAGTTTWKQGNYQIAALDTIWGASGFSIPNDVPPGQQVTLTLKLTAPTTIPSNANCLVSGTEVRCSFRWIMDQLNVEAFGDVASSSPILIAGATPPPPKCPACPVGKKSCGCDDKGRPICIDPRAECP